MSPTPPPLVTVVTPAFRAVAHLPRCLASVKAQDYPAIEHVVIDGGSTDGTRELLEKSGVRYISEPDGGIYDAMSKGVRMARGEYVHILNADDAYLSPGTLSTLVRELESRSLDVVHARLRLERADGSLVRVLGRDASVAQLRRKCVVAHPTVLVRKSVYDRFGTFDPTLRIAGDYDFLLRVWPSVRVGFLDSEVVRMRVGGASTKPGHAEKSLREAAQVAIRHGASPLAATLRMHYEHLKFRLFFARRFRDSPPAE